LVSHNLLWQIYISRDPLLVDSEGIGRVVTIYQCHCQRTPYMGIPCEHCSTSKSFP